MLCARVDDLMVFGMADISPCAVLGLVLFVAFVECVAYIVRLDLRAGSMRLKPFCVRKCARCEVLALPEIDDDEMPSLRHREKDLSWDT